MRRPGWDARRRNRNIGTAKSGHGQDNKMRIPEHWIGGKWILFHEQLDNPVVLTRTIGDRNITILVEPVHSGFLHACTPDDIAKVLRLLPPQHTEGIDLVVLRQPKRKERILSPVWGRLQYYSEIQQYRGVAIHIEAHPSNGTASWEKSLSPDNAQELERLVEDGHQLISERRHYVLHMTPESIRATQLYRTLPHEVGHYVDYLNTIGADEHNELFWSKPSRDKEAFAHRYAREFWEREKKVGTIPFQRILDEEVLTAAGLSLTWFAHHNNPDAADTY
jgi:hypothetical protein